MYDGKLAAATILKRTTAELSLAENTLCTEDHFALDGDKLYFHPKNHKEAETVLEAYNKLRTSPLIKALE